jgi:hypothetical protein
MEMDLEFRYQFLGRLIADIKYYLQTGNTKRLHYLNVNEHIEETKKLYKTFAEDEKPQWIEYRQILKYEFKMLGVDGNEVNKKSL